jgi:hypothetical protein
MSKIPKMWTYEKWVKMTTLDSVQEFNKEHKTDFNVSSGDNDLWRTVCGADWAAIGENAEYERYKKWYYRNFTKLGQALK